MPTPPIKSVGRAFQVLAAFNENRSVLSTREIADALDMNRKTVHRFLVSLENEGAITRVGRGQYTLGMTLADLGNQVAVHRVLADAAMPHIMPLAEQLNESVQLGILERDEIVSIAHVPSRHTLSIGIRVGMRWPAYCTAIGKTLLAGLTEPGLKEYLGRIRLERRTTDTITDPVRFARHIDEVRRQGYAVNDQESEVGMRGIAVPVRNRQSRYIAALSVSGPSARLPLSSLDGILRGLGDCSASVSAALYGSDGTMRESTG